jgi:hypothetical protein
MAQRGRPPKAKTEGEAIISQNQNVGGVTIFPEKKEIIAKVRESYSKPKEVYYEKVNIIKDNKELIKIYQINHYDMITKRTLFWQGKKIKGQWKKIAGFAPENVLQIEKVTGIKING